MLSVLLPGPFELVLAMMREGLSMGLTKVISSNHITRGSAPVNPTWHNYKGGSTR